MLNRVPEVPVLTEAEEKASRIGYYRINILGIHDKQEDLEERRLCGNSLRQGKVLGQPLAIAGMDNRRSTRVRSKNVKKSANACKSTSNQKGENSKKVPDKKQVSSALESNIGDASQTEITEAFKKLDAIITNGDDDDSEADESLVSSAELKVLQSTVKMLKRKLFEKSEECTILKKKNTELEIELVELRSLNRNFQNRLLDFLNRPDSASSSSSKLSSLSAHSSPLQSSKLSSLSAPSSPFQLSSPLCRSVDRLHTLQPRQTNKRLRLASACDNQSKENHPPLIHRFDRLIDSNTSHNEDGGSNLKDRSDFGVLTEPFDNSFDCRSSESNRTLTEEVSLNCDERDSQDIDSCDLDCDDINSRLNESSLEEGYEVFCKGFPVKTECITIINKYSLAKENDSKFVKDMAVAVFSMKVLVNSSVTGQKYRLDKAALQRPALDPSALEEIRARLQARVEKEFVSLGRKPNAEDQKRYSMEKVNYYIKEKIKKLRGNKNLLHKLK